MKPTTINLNLTAEEAVFIHNVLGQLPTSSNAHPLYMKAASQIQQQAPQAMPQQDNDEVEVVSEV